MEKNEGTVDRIIRFIVSLVALYLSFNYSLWWLVLAVPMLLTSLTGFCWPYKILGINTAKRPVLRKLKSKKKKY